MTDPTSPEPPDRDERLGAWLDGDLTEREAEAVAAEVDADPELAARLEAIREVRERLAGSTTTEVPGGFTARVQQAVAHEADDATAPGGGGVDGREAGPAPAEPHAAAPRAQTVSLAEARERRRRRWVAAGSVAAAVVAVAVLTPLVGDLAPTTEDAADVDLAEEAEEAEEDGQLDDAGSTGSEDAAPEALDSEAADDAAGGDEEAGAHGTGSGDERLRATSAGPVPRLVDEQRVFHSSGALRDHAADRPEAVELLDTPPGRADELAERTADTLRDAEPFDDGTDPAACLARVTGRSDGPAVLARVERLVLDGEALTAHLVVSGPPDAPLDTITLQVRDPHAGCDSRLTHRLR